jgi:hypothetical protein
VEHWDLPRFLGTLVIVLGAAKVFGYLAQRIGQPAVLGELVGGMVIGASVLGWIDAHGEIIHLLAELGVMILLLLIGMETDLQRLLKAGLASTAVAVAGVAIPFALGYAIGGTLTGALLALFWGGFVRVFFVHHITWSINSICHFFGSRRFETDDRSTNVAWLAVPSLGEAWHHNHHAFPRAADQGMRWWEIDISGLTIRAREKVGLAWNVIVISPERQAQRMAEGPARQVRQAA